MPGLAQASWVKEDDSPVVEAEGADIGEFSGLTWESSGCAGLSIRGCEGQAQAVETVLKATGSHGRVGTTK